MDSHIRDRCRRSPALGTPRPNEVRRARKIAGGKGLADDQRAGVGVVWWRGDEARVYISERWEGSLYMRFLLRALVTPQALGPLDEEACPDRPVRAYSTQ